MKEIERQLTLADTSEEYERFVEKFKPKKTTDDCYTPDNIYKAVKDWVCREYGIDESRIVRPFWPGGDYERFPYEEDSVVLDNPPFSIVARIVDFYNRNGIPFFIFAPYLTNFNHKMKCSHVIQGRSITYENGAEIGTSFLTSLDSCLARSAPELEEAIRKADIENLKKTKKQTPKYSYPPQVLRATDLGYLSGHGVDFRVMKEDCFFVRGLDEQRPAGKNIFGGGFLLSESAAARISAAKRKVDDNAALKLKEQEICWKLSERERAIVKSLGKGNKNENENTT